MCTESKDIAKKVSKIGLPNQTGKIWHIFADISGLGAYFSYIIFALKPWDWAGWVEYHEPYNRNDFFFTYKGVKAILTTKREALPIGPQSSSLCFKNQGNMYNENSFFVT